MKPSGPGTRYHACGCSKTYVCIFGGLMTGHFAKLVHPMMSRMVQPVTTPASDAISVDAWRAGQRIALTFCSARPAATVL
jgi:hypothetical protein